MTSVCNQAAMEQCSVAQAVLAALRGSLDEHRSVAGCQDVFVRLVGIIPSKAWSSPQSLRQSSLADARCGTRFVRATPSLAAVFALVLAAFVLCMTLCVPQALADDAVDPFAQAITVDMPDGSYSVDVAISGGSGRASIASPALLTVQGGHVAVTVVWSSQNYDYMKVGDQKYTPLTFEPGSTFQIPVMTFDEEFAVIGDTTAMSQAHEVEYGLKVARASIVAGAPAAPSSSASAASASASSASASSSSNAASSSAASSSSAANAQSGTSWTFVIPVVLIVGIVVGIVFGVIHYRKGRDQ